jgi:hypothetical protein
MKLEEAYRAAKAGFATRCKCQVVAGQFAVRADWAEPSSQIETLTSEGEWRSTGWQVAGFCHDGFEALSAVVEDCADGDDDFVNQVMASASLAEWPDEDGEADEDEG